MASRDEPTDPPLPPPSEPSPLVSFLSTLFAEALRQGATAVHLQTIGERLTVRFRVGGTLFQTMDVSRKIAPAVIGRLKTMSGLDVAERRLPQEGRLRLRLEAGEGEFAVLTLPSRAGESVTLKRIDMPDER